MPILYRDDGTWGEEEAAAASKHFRTYPNRGQVSEGDLVIGRYSVLPYYAELEYDIEWNHGKLINSYKEHRYVADLGNWYRDLEDITPTTYFNFLDIPTDYPGALVLKGETNSRKFKWNTHMFAKDLVAAKDVFYRLLDDTLIGQQQIMFREFVEFDTLTYGINGLPVTREFRFFVAYGKVISGGFYWSSAVEDLKDAGIKIPEVSEVPQQFLDEVTQRVGSNCTFYVVDIAQTKSGEWMVVELNDGQMSGLSENDPEVLYKNLREAVIENEKEYKLYQIG